MLEHCDRFLLGLKMPSKEISVLLHSALVESDQNDVAKGCLIATNLTELKYIKPDLFDHSYQQFSRVNDLIETYFLKAK